MGAIPMGAPGWPELAFCTASIASVRIVLMQVCSRSLSAKPPSLTHSLVPRGFVGVSTFRQPVRNKRVLHSYVIFSGGGPARAALPRLCRHVFSRHEPYPERLP